MSEVVQLPLPFDNPFAKFDNANSPILFPVGERPIGWQLRDGAYQRTESHKAIIRVNKAGDAAHLLNVVGASYKLVHNRELFNAVQDTMIDEMLPEHLKDVKVTDRVSGYGRICYREYIFPSIRRSFSDNKADISFRIIVQNGYGGSGLRLLAGAIDHWCTNGMVIGDYTSTYRKHTSGLILDNLKGTITDALLKYTAAQELWQQWMDIAVSHDAMAALFDAIAPSNKMREGLMDQYTRERDERGPNLWALYSTLTAYASHNTGAFTLRRTVDEQDTVAQTMLTRELNVAKWIRSPEWRALEMV